MKEPTEGMKLVAKALMPDPPGTHETRELLHEVGRAIVHLSNIEELLAMVFAVLSVPVATEVATELFHDQGAFDKKLKLTNYMVLHRGRSHELTSWAAVYSRLQNHRGVRNLIAHQGLFQNPPDAHGQVSVALRPAWFKKKGGKHLKASEIKSTADELDKIRLEIWDLVKSLSADL